MPENHSQAGTTIACLTLVRQIHKTRNKPTSQADATCRLDSKILYLAIARTVASSSTATAPIWPARIPSTHMFLQIFQVCRQLCTNHVICTSNSRNMLCFARLALVRCLMLSGDAFLICVCLMMFVPCCCLLMLMMLFVIVDVCLMMLF